MIDDRLPKYYLVKKSIVEKIENEEFQPGELKSWLLRDIFIKSREREPM